MKKLIFASFLLAGFFSANAQTIRAVGAGSVTTSSTGGNSSVNVGPNAGNILSSNTGGSNVFVGGSSGPANTTGSANTFVGANSGFKNTTGTNNVFIGGNAGNLNTTGVNNVFTGVNAGFNNTTASQNNFYGMMSGFNNTIGSGNSFFGHQTGGANSTGSQNTFMGSNTGGATTTGGDNTFLGWAAGPANTVGTYNTYIGRSSGTSNTIGNYNTIVGALAGQSNVNGGGNIFVGFGAGGTEVGSDKLYIANSNTSSPLIYGDFASSQLKLHGKVGIGGNNSTTFGSFPTLVGSANVSSYNLFVKGGILTDEVRVALNSTWADYVFAEDYQLPTIEEVEAFIAKNNHLPNVPSAAQVKEDGINVAEMTRIQQEKIEELMLYIIQLNKEVEGLKSQLQNNSKK